MILFPVAAENERASNIVRLPSGGPHFMDSWISNSSSLECCGKDHEIHYVKKQYAEGGMYVETTRKE